MTSSLVVVPTGTANVASVLAAFIRLGTEPAMAHGPEDVATAERVVLPGVGAFGAAMSELNRLDLNTVLAERLQDGRPTLAVCVGMQLLAAKSEESPHVAGLGIVGAEVKRFEHGHRVPQLGWNQVEAARESGFLVDGWAYFANSYRLSEVPEGWVGATSDHGGRFVAAIERGDVLACQFHPELSGAWGSALLARWLGGGS